MDGTRGRAGTLSPKEACFLEWTDRLMLTERQIFDESQERSLEQTGADRSRPEWCLHYEGRLWRAMGRERPQVSERVYERDEGYERCRRGHPSITWRSAMRLPLKTNAKVKRSRRAWRRPNEPHHIASW